MISVLFFSSSVDIVGGNLVTSRGSECRLFHHHLLK